MTMEERIEQLNQSSEVYRSDTEKRAYTVSDIQDILSIGKNAAYDLVNSGKFKVLKIGKSIRIPKKSFDEWMERAY